MATENKSRSNDQGRAYEYAWINTLSEALNATRKTKIIENSSLAANKKAWNNLDKTMQELYKLSAKSAVETLIELEPRMLEDDGDELLLEAQVDKKGETGDVRDILIKRNDIQWEIGLSIKHNHAAVKHCRLSHVLDFGKEWYGIPCSDKYWNDIAPIFDEIEKEKDKNWSEVSKKEDRVYKPLLQAFIKEVESAYASDNSVATKLTEYLIGKCDYYKVISEDKKRLTLIHTFNVHRTLNQPSKVKVSAISVPVVDLPTELVALKFKTGSKNTIEMYLNNGWEFSLRIHSASTKVQSSLKFDIQFLGMPASVLTFECMWK